jgi:hypothetical protein
VTALGFDFRAQPRYFAGDSAIDRAFTLRSRPNANASHGIQVRRHQFLLSGHPAE